jgi:Ca2+-binding RTX toxin-like protein
VNTLLVNDSGDDSGDRLTLGTDTIGLGEGDTFLGPGGGLRQAGMVTVSIVTGAGPDVLVLAGAPFGGIATAGGDDRVVLEPDATLAGTLDGGPGTDTLDYTAWTTAAFVNLGSGEASGTGGVAGFERVEGGGGNDSITGQYSAPSALLGFGGNDRLTGGSGTDLLDGGAGNDSLSGSFADDRYVLGAGGVDRVTDNAGRDTLDFSSAPSAVRVDLSLRKGERQRLGKSKAALRLSGDVENVVGSRFADVIAGTGAANHLQGGGGKDSLTGRRGDDRLDGGAGRDTLVERADAHFALSAKRLVGVGKDTLTSIESARLTGGVSANRLVVKGFRGAVALAGGAGDDLLVGGPKADTLAGEAGDDTLDGGPGRDAVDGGAGFDTSVADAADRLLAVESAG